MINCHAHTLFVSSAETEMTLSFLQLQIFQIVHTYAHYPLYTTSRAHDVVIYAEVIKMTSCALDYIHIVHS